jgi:hypothetical protein
MKILLFTVTFLCLSPFLRAQHFSINNQFYDSIDVNSYDLYFTGNALFNDSMKVYYSVHTNDSIPQLLFIDSVDFTADSVIYPSGFTCNAVDSTLSIDFGNYTTPYLILQLFSKIDGWTQEHIYVNVLNYELYLEDEED